MSGFFGRSFYNEVDQIIKSHDDRLEYDAKFCEKKKEIKFILELYQLEDDEIKEIQEKCLKIFLDEKKKKIQQFLNYLLKIVWLALHVIIQNILPHRRNSKKEWIILINYGNSKNCWSILI